MSTDSPPPSPELPTEYRTREEWEAKGIALFGTDRRAWRFACPCCKHEATVADWMAAGAPEGAVAFSCVGRWAGSQREAFGSGPGPCNYAGGGLFGLNPVRVCGVGSSGCDSYVFQFAPLPQSQVEAKS